MPLRLKGYESSFVPLWVCPDRKLPLKRLCAASKAHYYKTNPWPKSLMICTAAATHSDSYFATEKGATSPTQVQLAIVCPRDHHQSQDYHYSRLDLECWLPFRQSPPSKHPRHVPRAEILHWCLQSPFPRHSKVLKLPRSTGCCNSRSSFSGIH